MLRTYRDVLGLRDPHRGLRHEAVNRLVLVQMDDTVRQRFDIRPRVHQGIFVGSGAIGWANASNSVAQDCREPRDLWVRTLTLAQQRQKPHSTFR